MSSSAQLKTTPRRITEEVKDSEVATLARVWNRSHPASRQEFLDMAKESKGGLIDP